MTIEDKKKYYWEKYGIRISYDLQASEAHKTRSGHRDQRVIRYRIDYPGIAQEGIIFKQQGEVLLEFDENVSSSLIDYHIRRYFKRNPGRSEVLQREMKKFNRLYSGKKGGINDTRNKNRHL